MEIPNFLQTALKICCCGLEWGHYILLIYQLPIDEKINLKKRRMLHNNCSQFYIIS